MPYQVVIVPAPATIRLLVTDGPDELLRARLPAALHPHATRAAATLLEGLALWLNAKLHVVLCVDAADASCCLGLTDDLGVGVCSLFFDVEVRDRRTRRRRGRRLRGLGAFGDLRQLRLGMDDH